MNCPAEQFRTGKDDSSFNAVELQTGAPSFSQLSTFLLFRKVESWGLVRAHSISTCHHAPLSLVATSQRQRKLEDSLLNYSASTDPDL